MYFCEVVQVPSSELGRASNYIRMYCMYIQTINFDISQK